MSCLRRDGLGEPEELLELELREVLELPERLEAEEELEPLLEPVLELDPELDVELDRDLVEKQQKGLRRWVEVRTVSQRLTKDARVVKTGISHFVQF